jgi:hypothetical protein
MTAPARPAWTTETRAPSRDIIEAISSEWWWQQWFRYGDWSAWRVYLSAIFALPMNAQQLALFQACTARSTPPAVPVKETWVVAGRRGGKSRVMALTAAWLAAFHDWRPHLAPGERASILLISADRKQSRVLLRYLRSLLVQHPLLKQLITRDVGEIIELSCGTSIEITTASFRTTRGYSVADWRSDENSNNPADEIIAALRPALSTMPGSLLMAVSSPHARRGPLWDAYRKHYGEASDRLLVWQAPTRTMNPTVDQGIIDDALEEDPARASSEYLATFRSDVEAFVSKEVVDSVTVQGRYELPRVTGTAYVGAIDPSGGSSDSMTLAVAHYDHRTKRAVLDAVRERRPPFSPDDVTLEFTALLRAYGISRIQGDRYAGEWPRERFRIYGITYEPCERNKSEAYAELLPLLNSGRVELLDHKRLVSQLCALERRTARGGRDTIDHMRGAHDDVANASALALILAANGGAGMLGLRITPAMIQRGMQPSFQQLYGRFASP